MSYHVRDWIAGEGGAPPPEREAGPVVAPDTSAQDIVTAVLAAILAELCDKDPTLRARIDAAARRQRWKMSNRRR